MLNLIRSVARTTWKLIKEVGSFLWNDLVKPAARWVGRTFGLERQTEAVLEKADGVIKTALQFLETDVAPLFDAVWDAVQQRLERWLIATFGTWGAIIAEALRKFGATEHEVAASVRWEDGVEARVSREPERQA